MILSKFKNFFKSKFHVLLEFQLLGVLIDASVP
ncbi:unnamed protein product, partial [marine sediment metagenome]